MTTRRDFLAAGAASLLAGRALLDASAATELTDALLPTTTEGVGDYLLSPGLVYLNTGSTGPSTKAGRAHDNGLARTGDKSRQASLRRHQGLLGSARRCGSRRRRSSVHHRGTADHAQDQRGDEHRRPEHEAECRRQGAVH